jgi:hypothetical protein
MVSRELSKLLLSMTGGVLLFVTGCNSSASTYTIPPSSATPTLIPAATTHHTDQETATGQIIVTQSPELPTPPATTAIPPQPPGPLPPGLSVEEYPLRASHAFLDF